MLVYENKLMKNCIKSVLLFSLLLFACTKSSDNKTNVSLIGKWRLTETLVDPGDGSGKWTKVNSDDYIQFTEDSTYQTNKPATGDIVKFSLPTDSTITFIYVTGQSSSYYYKINGNELTIMGGCYEACGSKYVKQD